ncbi:MAG: cbb3-type cytochrome oxidase assembly protein CcoS [Pseudomonadota bacterium]
MNVLVFLIPVSLTLGGLGLLAFVWSLRSRQYDDPEGHAARILTEDSVVTRPVGHD